MSTRAKAAAILASAGVFATVWNVSTASSQTVTTPATTTTATTTTTTTTVTATPTTVESSTATTSTDTGSATTLKDGTYTGITETHRYGSVTVTVTVADGQITKISEDVVSDGDHHSDMINERSIPAIESEVLAANSADVSTISGATYTTQAFLDSLQSALDQAA